MHHCVSWGLIFKGMDLGYWPCVQLYMDIQSRFTIVVEMLTAGVELMASRLSCRQAFTHRRSKSTWTTEPLYKEIKDYTWQYECRDDGNREIHGLVYNAVTAQLVQSKIEVPREN